MSVSEERALHYHRIQEEDIPALLAIEQEAFPDPWTQGMFRQEIDNPCSEFFVVRLDGHIAAYVGFWLVLDEAHITKVTVADAFRKQGLGREVLAWLLHRAEQMGANIARLEVRESNTAARALYAAANFTENGIRKGYYAQSNESAVVMSRTLRTV
jgi:ribosomal-protein-alanine N-acetyltransferase